MRILFLSSWFPFPQDNGSKIRIHNLLKAISIRHDITLLAFAYGTAQPDLHTEVNSYCKNVRLISCDPVLENQVNSVRRFLSLRPVSSRPIGKMMSLVQKEITENEFDVVIASTDVMAVYALNTGQDVTKILELHNSLTRWMRERFYQHTNWPQKARCWLTWKKAQVYESKLFNSFDLVTMVSHQDKTEPMLRIGLDSRHIHVVANGVDCQSYRPMSLPVQANTLIYNGAITYSANFDAVSYFLQEILPLIRQTVPDVLVKVTGSISNVDISKLSLDRNVQFTGFVDDIRPLVGRATACVAPIREGGGTRLKILEAMALGTPVVATSKAAEGLEVVDGKHILLADNPEEFSEKTIRLLFDSRLRESIVQNARQLVEKKYDWQDIGRLFAALVEKTNQERLRKAA